MRIAQEEEGRMVGTAFDEGHGRKIVFFVPAGKAGEWKVLNIGVGIERRGEVALQKITIPIPIATPTPGKQRMEARGIHTLEFDLLPVLPPFDPSKFDPMPEVDINPADEFGGEKQGG